MHPHAEDAVVHWYETIEDEGSRLARAPHSRLEALRTREIVARYLPSTPARVLDVGGGPGAYAAWLVGLGHTVDLVDVVPRHVEAANAIDGVSASLGDARALAADDDAYDLTLALGPLYHLASRDDRVRALRESARVTRPGGPVIAAAIGRYAVLTEFALLGAFRENRVTLEPYVRSGENADEDGFPVRHAHLADELAEEAREAGWTDVQVLAVEGPVGYAVSVVPPERHDDVVAEAAAVAALVESDPRVIDTSPHLLVVGRAAD